MSGNDNLWNYYSKGKKKCFGLSQQLEIIYILKNIAMSCNIKHLTPMYASIIACMYMDFIDYCYLHLLSIIYCTYT